jgi:asparagine synthase (glutamine-hydrolysing)
VTGIRASDIWDDLEAHVSGYPEKDLAQKYVHFLLYERAFKWLFEGEDRNRCFFWAVAPFYGTAIFDYAMGCRDEQKKHYRLYRSVLMTLSPSIAAINNANWGFPIASTRTGLHSMAREIMSKYIPRIVKVVRAPSTATVSAAYFACLSTQARNCPLIKDYIPLLGSNDIENYRNRTRANTLLTVTSAIEQLSTGRSSLSLYPDCIPE